MDILTIPIQQIPDQVFYVTLGEQECEIHLYLRFRYMYMDLIVDDKTLFQGKICLNGVNMVEHEYLGFKGQLKFVDTQGFDDPYYTGFDERWFLTYVQ